RPPPVRPPAGGGTLLPDLNDELRSPQIHPLDVLERLIARRDHALAGAEAGNHLDGFRIAPSERDVPAAGRAAIAGDDQHPEPARLVIEGSVGDDERFGRLAQLDPRPQRLATAYSLRSLAGEFEIDGELPLTHIRIDLGDAQIVRCAADVDRRRLPEGDAAEIELVDHGGHLVGIHGVDLADALARS